MTGCTAQTKLQTASGSYLQILSRNSLNPGTKTAYIAQGFIVVRNHLRCRRAGVAGAGMRVFNQRDRKAQRKCAACGGIDTKLGMHAANDQIRHAQALEQRLKLSMVKGVRRGLAHAQVGRIRRKPIGKLPGRRFEFQVTGARLMLNKDDRHSRRPRFA